LITVDEFFRTISEADKPKFEPLKKILTSESSGTRKIGDQAEKIVVIAGKTQDKGAGARTDVVET
jgi:hypothetical protein